MAAFGALADGLNFPKGIMNVIGGKAVNGMHFDDFIVVAVEEMFSQLAAKTALVGLDNQRLSIQSQGFDQHGADGLNIGAGFEKRRPHVGR